ncbi:hypothetical protein D0Z03_001131 [Geotrichum reessii]|nr:hypothetical protein D0Z03_001131 [Galactomyces reessii]
MKLQALVLSLCLGAALAQSNADSSSAKSVVTSSSSFNVESYYSSLNYNVVSFYDDFLRNRNNYANNYKRFFISHTFSGAGTWGSVLPQMTTYTDDSFTSNLSATPELVTVLASIATQFPWYTSWVEKNPYSSAQATGGTEKKTSSASDAGLVQVSRQSMKLALSVFTALFVLFFMSFVGF